MHSLMISPQELNIVKTIFQNRMPSGIKVFVFGSRATGTAGKFSDLDLAIDANQTPLDFFKTAELREAFDESDLPYKVDIVDLNEMSKKFKSLIDRDKQLLDVQ